MHVWLLVVPLVCILWLIAAGMNTRVGPGVVGSVGRKVHENVFVVF